MSESANGSPPRLATACWKIVELAGRAFRADCQRSLAERVDDAHPSRDCLFAGLERGRRGRRSHGLGLLHLARNDAAGQIAKFECLDLSMLLKDVVDSLAPLVEDKGLKLIDNVPDDGLAMRGDSDSLIRLFMNLLNNAIKYTEHGSITISAKPKDEKFLVVTISDMGVGIASDHLPHIFDRFYRHFPGLYITGNFYVSRRAVYGNSTIVEYDHTSLGWNVVHVLQEGQ